MQLNDSREIQADPATVYAAILDPEVLKACVPGASEVGGNPEEGYTATVTQNDRARRCRRVCRRVFRWH